MESLFFIQRYMGSDDDDDDSYQQVSTSKSDNTINSFSDFDTAIPVEKQKSILDNLDCSDSVEGVNYSSSDIYNSVDSQTKSQKKERRKKKLEKCLQNVNERKLKDLENVGDNLNSTVAIDSEIEILNDLEYLGSVKRIDKSSGSNEKIISEVKLLKKRRKKKIRDVQILQNSEENGLQKSNTSNLEDSKIINEYSCSSIEDITDKNWAEVTDWEITRKKKQKTKSTEQTQSSKKCKSDVSNFENTKIIDLEIEDEEQETETAKQSHRECKSDLSNSGNTEVFCTIGRVQHKEDIKCRQALPHWLSNPIYINMQEEKVAVSELDYLDSGTKKNLIEAGLTFLFPVQLTVVPWLVKKAHCSRLLYPPSDICVSAPTGSGKTLAFVLPIVQALKVRVVTAIRALVVLPVSELAIQVYKVFKTFTQGTNLQVVLLTGQKSFLKEQQKLVRFKSNKKVLSLADIVIGTPGRIRDHVYRTDGVCLKPLRYLVIDEADRMMEEIQQGWFKQIEDAVFQDGHSSNCVCGGNVNRKRSRERTCAADFRKICEPLHTLLFSATLTLNPEQLHALPLYKPKLFTASTPNFEQKFIGLCVIPDKLTMLQVICAGDTKPMIICHLIKQYQFKRVLCFTESVERAHKLNLILEAMQSVNVREISSLKQAVQRKIVLKQFASGRVNVLVCSDLLSRGIDIANVDCVISYDVPQCNKIYVHRIGRTARAEKRGTAITLLSEGEIPHFKKILKLSGLELPDTVTVNSEDLKPFLSSYQAALLTAKANSKKKRKRNGLIVTKGQLLQRNRRNFK